MHLGQVQAQSKVTGRKNHRRLLQGEKTSLQRGLSAPALREARDHGSLQTQSRKTVVPAIQSDRTKLVMPLNSTILLTLIRLGTIRKEGGLKAVEAEPRNPLRRSKTDLLRPAGGKRTKPKQSLPIGQRHKRRCPRIKRKEKSIGIAGGGEALAALCEHLVQRKAKQSKPIVPRIAAAKATRSDCKGGSSGMRFCFVAL